MSCSSRAPVFIDELRLVDMPDAETAVFEARCGKGTYVRAIARDMGRVLGCFGHVIALAPHARRPVPRGRGRHRSRTARGRRGRRTGDVAAFLQPVEAALDLLHLNCSVRPTRCGDLGRASPC